MSTEKVQQPPLRLYHYWRSSRSWRVRWAFALKRIQCEFIPVDLLNGESESPEHLARNPFGFVPSLEFLELPGTFLTESLAIIEWAEEMFPEPRLIPGTAFKRAQIRQLAETINAGTQPLQNLGPQYLYSDDLNKRKEWAAHWIRNGLQAYETLVKKTAGIYSVGDTITLADLCLIPQCYNATRFEVDIAEYPTVQKIYKETIKTEGYKLSEPENYNPNKTK